MVTKYIFVTGGVVSSLGKGITAASIGQLLKSRGLKVTIQKFDPYINVDPGTLSPYQHGEVFVTEDGAETDLDLGHYERFIDENLTKHNSVTSGSVYWTVISKERKGDYEGKTVQVIPHITNEIKERIIRISRYQPLDVVITEIGGTVGDIESLPFMEAIRQIKHDVGKENVMYIHVTLIPYLSMAGELKTKPTQHSVKELRSIGIHPDALICRTEKPLGRELKEKVALFCDLEIDGVIENMDSDSIYNVPRMMEEQGLGKLVERKLGLQCKEVDLSSWDNLVNKMGKIDKTTRIALVGKYVELKDSYLSVYEALTHGGIANGTDVQIDWINAENLNDQNAEIILGKADGILVPGGFGHRGIEGKISAIRYAREKRIPYLGLCLGMQLACVELARNKAGLYGAHSTELDENTPHPVIYIMPDQKNVRNIGGTLRLGSYPCQLGQGTRAREIYGSDIITERHRHRYEFNNEYRNVLEEAGMIFSGLSPDNSLVEVVELKDHPWFVAVQYHPEFKSRPTRPHPLFDSFIEATLKNSQ
ncbi:CTP synthase [Gudongella sp. DL1XJH-153]|uniref:CTP synthase n=1 Tax=Gudongella sp. DL1XJH-153 TaxID=3409804 RepID=UPI003BB75BEF